MKPWSTRLAAGWRVEAADWPEREMEHVAFVEGSFVLGQEEATPSLWKLLERLPALQWVAGQMALAALFAALAGAATGEAAAGPALGRRPPGRSCRGARGAARGEPARRESRSTCLIAIASGAAGMLRVRGPPRGPRRAGRPATETGPDAVLAASGEKAPAQSPKNT